MSVSVSNIAKVQIEALSSRANYPTWRIRIQELLRREELLEHISQDAPDVETSTAAAVNRWKKKDASARSLVVLHLGTEATTSVTTLLNSDATAKDVWNKLKNIYQKSNLQARLNIDAKLHKVEYKDGSDFDKHVQEMKTLFVEMASLGGTIDDEHKSGHLLRSLPDSFSNLASLASSSEIGYDDICARVKFEIDRREGRKLNEKPKDEEKPSSITPGARKAIKKRHPNGNRFPNVQCHYCLKFGHFQRDCRKRQNDSKNGRGRGRGRGFRYRPRGRNGPNRGRVPNRFDSQGDSHYNPYTPSPHTGFNSNGFPPPPQGPSGPPSYGQNNGNYGASQKESQNNMDWQPRGFMARHREKRSRKARTNATWIDSGANDNFVWDRNLLEGYEPLQGSAEICEGNSVICGKGTIKLKFGSTTCSMEAKHTPNFDENVIAASKLARFFRIVIEDSDAWKGCTLEDYGTKDVVFRSPLINGLYPCPPIIKPGPPVKALHSTLGLTSTTNVTSPSSAADWHEILGHVGRDRLVEASLAGIGIPPMAKSDLEQHFCPPCVVAASKQSPVYPLNEIAEFPLNLTHSDIAGPIDPATPSGKKYTSFFLDDSTRMAAIYFLSQRSQYPESLIAYKALAENEQQRRLYRLRLDRAGENTSTVLVQISINNGMLLEYSPAYASESNGAAERLVQELWKMARTFLFASRLPQYLWAEALSHACWIRNRLPNSRIDFKIPYELWYGRKPDLSTVLKFGQTGYAFQYRPDTAKGKKLLPRSLFGFFVGMQSSHRLYRVFIPSEGKVSPCRVTDFTIVHDQTPLPSFSSLLEDLSRYREDEERDNKNAEAEEVEETIGRCLFAAYSQTPIALKAKKRDKRLPRTFEEACKDPTWAEAIDREYDALVTRKTWITIPLERGMDPISFTWDFRIKETTGTDVDMIFKARCCLRGDKQLPFRDFDPDELYAPVARHETIRMLLAKVGAQDLFLEGADIANAYLYGDLDKPVLMKLLTNSTGTPSLPNHVALVVKSMYGHKAAGAIWGSLLHDQIISWGFKQSTQDARMYLLKTTNGFIILVIVVDDIALASNNRMILETVKQQLAAKFKVKFMGSLKAFIGWELVRTPSGIHVHQKTYLKRVIKNFNLQHVKPQPTPVAPSAYVSALHDMDEPLSKVDHARFRSLVGSLMYAAVCTRPDISFAISTLARQMHAPAERHLVLAKRLVRYLIGTLEIGLFYPKANGMTEGLTGYSDADWAGCRDTRKSTTGILITVNGAPIAWTSKRQSMVSLSSAEAEYIATSHCAKHIIWLRRLFVEMMSHEPCLAEPAIPPSIIRIDNTAALALATNPQVSERNKHIELKVHHIRHLLQGNVIVLEHVPTEFQLADILTKPLHRARFEFLLRSILSAVPYHHY